MRGVGWAVVVIAAVQALVGGAAPARASRAPVDGAADPGVIRFGAGSKTGGFTKLATAIATQLAGSPTATGARAEVDVEVTKGSCENIRRLLAGELDMALVQYDVAAEAFRASQMATAAGDSGGGGWMCEISTDQANDVELGLVAALAEDAVHVLVRRPMRVDSLQALADHRAFVGSTGSGTFETAKVILGAGGLIVEDLQRFEGSNSKALEALRTGEVQVALQSTEPGDDAIAEIVGLGVASVNPLPEDVIDRLIDGYPYYRVCQIEPRTYPGLEFGIPTVCMTTVIVTALPRAADAAARQRQDAQVGAVIDALLAMEADPAQAELGLDVRWTGFAEREPIPLHPVAMARAWATRRDQWLWQLGGLLLALGGLLGVRAVLRRRGVLKDPLNSSFEGQLSNPLVPFVGFVALVLLATFAVWTLERDTNARVRTLNDSFWEMNMFATGNFDSEALKSSAARFVGAAATIAGLGMLAWFTAALTNIFSQDQTRLFRRLRNHIIILNFREDMLQLIRVLRSPGPLRHRPIHVVVSDTLPKRVRLQLAKVKGLTIYHRNPEVPEDLADLRVARAARVLVLEGDRYHPLRVARAVQQAATRFSGVADAAGGPELGRRGFSVAPPLQQPTLAGDRPTSRGPQLPITLVEAGPEEPPEVWGPFAAWLVPLQGRKLADDWLAAASADGSFAELFNGVVSFRDDNAEPYTVPLPEWLHGKPWSHVRAVVYGLQGRAGAIPLGLYRAHGGTLAYEAGATRDSSPQAEIDARLELCPDPDRIVTAADRLVALAEDESDLRRMLLKPQKAKAVASEPGPRPTATPR